MRMSDFEITDGVGGRDLCNGQSKPLCTATIRFPGFANGMNVISTRKFTELVLVKHQMYIMSTASTPEKIYDLSLRSFFGQRILWCGTTRQEKGREHWGTDGGLR